MTQPDPGAHPFGGAVARFDLAVDRAFDRIRGRPAFDHLFYAASALADWSLLWQLAGATEALADPGHLPASARLTATLGVESLTVNQGVKRLFGRVRPAAGAGGPLRLRRPLTSSFPSGHASAAACAAVLLIRRDRALAPLWLGLATLVAASRIYVRMHHASDVVAGAFIGWLIGEAAAALVPLPGDR